jgi:HEPN domain-containing protein
MSMMPAWLRSALERHSQRLPLIPTADRIFRSARNYHDASLRCFELRQGDGQIPFLPMQGMVLQAFASELYLKALYAIEQQASPPRWHELDKLFNKLDQTTQGNIAARYEARYGSGVLADDLRTFSRVFQEWRYSYEFSGGHEMDAAGLAHLASALYEICAELRPDLVQSGATHDRLTAAIQGVPILPA